MLPPTTMIPLTVGPPASMFVGVSLFLAEALWASVVLVSGLLILIGSCNWVMDLLGMTFRPTVKLSVNYRYPTGDLTDISLIFSCPTKHPLLHLVSIMWVGPWVRLTLKRES